MSIIFILIPLSVIIATGFLLAFVWAVKSGQYEDTCTPAMRLLTEEAGNASGPRAVPPRLRPEDRGEGISALPPQNRPASCDDASSQRQRTTPVAAQPDLNQNTFHQS